MAHGGNGNRGVAASLALAAYKSVVGLPRVIAIATGLFGVGLAAVAVSRSLPLSLVLMAATGFAMVAQWRPRTPCSR